MSVRPQISLVAALTLLVAAQAAAQSEAVLFADDFDGGNSGQNWTVRSYGTDYVADFAFDYSTRGIPSAPHSIGGSTIGLRMLANANDSTAATDAVSAYPLATNFTGDYSLKFDM